MISEWTYRDMRLSKIIIEVVKNHHPNDYLRIEIIKKKRLS